MSKIEALRVRLAKARRDSRAFKKASEELRRENEMLLARISGYQQSLMDMSKASRQV